MVETLPVQCLHCETRVAKHGKECLEVRRTGVDVVTKYQNRRVQPSPVAWSRLLSMYFSPSPEDTMRSSLDSDS